MIRIDMYDDVTGERLELGTLEDFISSISEEIGSVATVMTRAGFKKKAVCAFDNLFQKVRDEKYRQNNR